ncbi:MAG: acetoacetyl-CoA reductase [Alphaproteobacteria bacterium]|jgi:acetoacetyl-CoA reductase|nr:acetoacetyl-CoA reductase [Alphaproteobacteria bacterium]
MARTALVTGGTRGIGRAISQRLKEEGFEVAANFGGNEEKARQFTEETGIRSYKFNVGDFEAVGEGLKQIESEIGPVDVVVNNAGITRDAPFHKMGPEQWQEVIDVDLSSAFNVTRQVWEGMRERGFGRVVNISSINGQKGQFGQVNYSAAKAGLIGFTKALAQEGAKKGITVNCVAPGYVDTDMVAAVPENVLEGIISSIPVGRLGKAEEIADAVAWLSGERCGFVTGATIPVNGAQYIAG